ncbi:hypothetical protein AUR64_12670 [Haloprofundus marisrubri]|uniref:Peptidase M48 domain-containing protein n=1 Tax=Haloprofundus marisrubri TaxID=1514971 RepID=A0A0W1RAL9_9EURY|nr:M48 family metalloprotease [Haloprofundus marisrubri]KTG10411.1 hypothetical protein AUR64_12670 [Haloprofundus marisrubri]
MDHTDEPPTYGVGFDVVVATAVHLVFAGLLTYLLGRSVTLLFRGAPAVFADMQTLSLPFAVSALVVAVFLAAVGYRRVDAPPETVGETRTTGRAVELVAEAASRVNVTAPRVRVATTPVPNVVTVGSGPERTLVVTTKLLDTVDDGTLVSLVSRELHTTDTFARAIRLVRAYTVVPYALSAGRLRRARTHHRKLRGGEKRNENFAGYVYLSYLFAAVGCLLAGPFWAVEWWVVASLAQRRTVYADRVGALLTDTESVVAGLEASAEVALEQTGRDEGSDTPATRLTTLLPYVVDHDPPSPETEASTTVDWDRVDEIEREQGDDDPKSPDLPLESRLVSPHPPLEERVGRLYERA